MARDRQLMAHALGALDPGDGLTLDEQLREDPDGRFRLSGLGFLAGAPVGAKAVSLAVEAAPLLSDEAPPRPGDRASLRLSPPVPAGAVHPVLWRETSAGRDLLYPTPGGRWAPLDRLRRDGDAVVLDLVVGGPPGAHLYSLVLLPRDLYPEPWPPGDDRWGRLWEAFRAGHLPGAQVELTVRP